MAVQLDTCFPCKCLLRKPLASYFKWRMLFTWIPRNVYNWYGPPSAWSGRHIFFSLSSTRWRSCPLIRALLPLHPVEFLSRLLESIDGITNSLKNAEKNNYTSLLVAFNAEVNRICSTQTVHVHLKLAGSVDNLNIEYRTFENGALFYKSKCPPPPRLRPENGKCGDWMNKSAVLQFLPPFSPSTRPTQTGFPQNGGNAAVRNNTGQQTHAHISLFQPSLIFASPPLSSKLWHPASRFPSLASIASLAFHATRPVLVCLIAAALLR